MLCLAHVSYTVNSKANALLHFVSALYVGVMTAFVSLFVPESLVPAAQVHVLLMFGCAFVVFDFAAGFTQCRRARSAKLLSAVLHLAFSSTATVVIAFDYLFNRPAPFFGWLWRNDYAVFVALAANPASRGRTSDRRNAKPGETVKVVWRRNRGSDLVDDRRSRLTPSQIDDVFRSPVNWRAEGHAVKYQELGPW